MTQDTEWIEHSEKRKYQEFELEHYGIKQRWIVVFSKAAEKRALETVKKNIIKEKESIEKELLHLQADRFSCEPDARNALEEKSKK